MMYEVSYDVWFLRYGVKGQNFLSFWTIFCFFILNQNFEKSKKNVWRYHHFAKVYQKS